MSAIDTAMYALHLLVAGVWAGSVVFLTVGVLPTAKNGTANAAPLEFVVSRLRTISRASAVLLLVSGGHMASVHDFEWLTGQPRGYLVLSMVALWFVLAGLVEVGASKLADGFDDRKVREPAREARPFLLGATVVSLLLLINGGVLASPFVF